MLHPRLPAGAAHVFVADVVSPHLDSDDAHHLGRVLRLRAGESVTVADGRGAWRECVYRGEGALEPVGTVHAATALGSEVTVAFALSKSDKPELAVQKLTELGVDRIVLFAGARSVVVWDDAKTARNLARLRAVARSAAMQSRRVRLPHVEGITTLAALAATVPGMVLAAAGGHDLSETTTSVAVGPEGGWAPDELATVTDHVDLGTTTLRAETAAVAVGVLLTALRDGRVRGS